MNTARIFSDFNGTLETIRSLASKKTTGLSSSARTAVIAGITVVVVVLLLCIALARLSSPSMSHSRFKVRVPWQFAI